MMVRMICKEQLNEVHVRNAVRHILKSILAANAAPRALFAGDAHGALCCRIRLLLQRGGAL